MATKRRIKHKDIGAGAFRPPSSRAPLPTIGNESIRVNSLNCSRWSQLCGKNISRTVFASLAFLAVKPLRTSGVSNHWKLNHGIHQIHGRFDGSLPLFNCRPNGINSHQKAQRHRSGGFPAPIFTSAASNPWKRKHSSCYPSEICFPNPAEPEPNPNCG